MNLGEFLLLTALIMSIGNLIINIFLHKSKFSGVLQNIFLFSTIFCITTATLLLIYYQFTFNFQYAYVFNHVSTDLKPIYRVSALWAGQEGSFLLWAVISIWISLFKREDHKPYVIYTLISTVILVLAFSSKPFSLMNYIPTEGNGLNEALQDPWMVVHPPLVFIGYSSMAVLFSESFKKVNKKWIMISLLFLGAGILSGSLWAYRALGWGGYWAWDSIENAALIPWLILIAIVHKKNPSPTLYMLPFILAILGTFLARSGILKGVSVHSYASSSLTWPLLTALIFSILVLVIVLWRNKRKTFTKVKDNITKEKLLCLFRYSTYVFATYILVGTILPIFSGSPTKISFYNPAALTFVIFSSILSTIYMDNLFKENFIKLIIINTIITMIISMTTNSSSFKWEIILWVLILPLITNIVFFTKLKNVWRNISHIGGLLLAIGTITSSAFSEEGVLMKCNLLKIPLKKTMIVHKFLGDTIISSNGKYTTKPFIWIFWLGGFMMLAGILGSICFSQTEKSKKKQEI